MSARITLGISIESKEVKHISEVKNGLKCKCICVECGDKLIAVNNEENKKEKHFRHETDSNCSGGIETALHLLAKQIVARNTSIRLDQKREFLYTKADIELPLNDYCPDVIIYNEYLQQKWYIELAVTSFIKPDKYKKIKRDNVNCLEINLKEIDRNISALELEELIIRNTKLKKIICEDKSEKENKGINIFPYVIVFLLAIWGYRRIFHRKKSKATRP